MLGRVEQVRTQWEVPEVAKVGPQHLGQGEERRLRSSCLVELKQDHSRIPSEIRISDKFWVMLSKNFFLGGGLSGIRISLGILSSYLLSVISNSYLEYFKGQSNRGAI